MVTVDYEIVQKFGGEAEIAKRVQDFRSALALHRTTVGQPAPVEHSLIEQIARSDGKFTVSDPPPVVDVPPASGRDLYAEFDALKAELVGKGVIEDKADAGVRG